MDVLSWVWSLFQTAMRSLGLWRKDATVLFLGTSIPMCVSSS